MLLSPTPPVPDARAATVRLPLPSAAIEVSTPGPLSRTVINTSSPALAARSSIRPSPSTFATPCITAFSTSGCSTKLGTSASMTPTST